VSSGTDLRPAEVFGVDSHATPSTTTRVYAIVRKFLSGLMAFHRSQHTSPRLSPRVSNGAQATANRSLVVDARNALASSTDHGFMAFACA
jgi:hypothetical protein